MSLKAACTGKPSNWGHKCAVDKTLQRRMCAVSQSALGMPALYGHPTPSNLISILAEHKQRIGCVQLLLGGHGMQALL